MVLLMDLLLNKLADDRYQDVDYLASELKVKKVALNHILKFLDKYSFIEYSSGRAKLQPELKELLLGNPD